MEDTGNVPKSVEMAKTFKLPLLPGNTCGEDLLRRNFRKTQILTGKADTKIPRKPVPTDFDSTLVTQNAASPTKSFEAPPEDDSVHGKVLRYFGYYRERVPESPLEKERIRKVVLQYYLEDDTIAVSEPRVDNSGITFQGAMVKRHQITDDIDNVAITFDRLGIGRTVSFYGREFFLVDADAFTRKFMTAVGVTMPEALPYPADDYAKIRAPKDKVFLESMSTTINSSGMKVKLSASEVHATKQFLQNDRKVLRFGAVWDDTTVLYGQKHFLILYYFLSDDTIEICEKSEPNSGRDPFPSFLRRRKLVKPLDPSEKAKKPQQIGLLPPDQKEMSAQKYYTDADLRIGAKINVYNREILIYSYDKYTQDHMREKFGITEYTPITVAEPKKAPAKRIPPPYNGFGSEEDSLSSWRSLDIRPPRRDDSKYLVHGDNVVKFSLKLENNVATDEVRRFVLSCYLADDTISIFEPVQRNSGIVGGKFLQRQKVTNPKTGKPFVAADFYVGAHIDVNNYPFSVLATDERSLSYMEHNPDSFPHSNVSSIINRLRAMLLSASSGLFPALMDLQNEFDQGEATPKKDKNPKEALDFKKLAHVFVRLGLPINEQEVLTVLRYFDSTGNHCSNYEEFSRHLVLDDELNPGEDSRGWEEIYESFVSGEEGKANLQQQSKRILDKTKATMAAYAARAVLEAYAQRRQLFHSELRFASDYTYDNLISGTEFARVIRDKLKLESAVGSRDHLDALVEKLFPPRARRVTYDELLRLFNGTSQYPHTLQNIWQRKNE